MSSAPPSSDPLRQAEHVETKLAGAIAQVREAPATRAAGKAAKLGDQEPLYALAAALTLIGAVTRKPILTRAGIRMALAVAAADLSKSLIKKAVARSRPRVVIDEDRYDRGAGGSEEKGDQSFPSGHVACTVAAGRALGREVPELKPLLRVLVGGLGAARVAEGAHWPSDVAAGLAVGLAAEAATAWLVTVASRFGPVRRLVEG